MKWKKVIAAILAVTLVFGVLPGTVFAEGPAGTEGDPILLEDAGYSVMKLEDGKHYKIPSGKTITTPIVLSGQSYLTVEGIVDVRNNTVAEWVFPNEPAITVNSGSTVKFESTAKVYAYGSNAAIAGTGTFIFTDGSQFNTNPKAFIGENQKVQDPVSDGLYTVKDNTDAENYAKEFENKKTEYMDQIKKWLGEGRSNDVNKTLGQALGQLGSKTFSKQTKEELESELAELKKLYDSAKDAVDKYDNALDRKKQAALDQISAWCTEYGVSETEELISGTSGAKTVIENTAHTYQGNEDGYGWVNQFESILTKAKPHIEELGKLNKAKDAAKQALTDLVSGISVDSALTTATAAIDAVKYQLTSDFQTQTQVDQTWSSRLDAAKISAAKTLAKAAIDAIAKANKGDLDDTGVSAVTKDYTDKLNGDEVAWSNIENAVSSAKNELPLKLAKADAVAQLTTAAEEAIEAGANKTQAERYRDDGIANINIAPNKDIVTMYLNVALNNINGLKKDLENLNTYKKTTIETKLTDQILKVALNNYTLEESEDVKTPLNKNVKKWLDDKVNNAVTGIIAVAKTAINGAKSEDGVDTAYNQAVKDIQNAAALAIEKHKSIEGTGAEAKDGLLDYKNTECTELGLTDTVKGIIEKYAGPSDPEAPAATGTIVTAASTYEVNSELAKAKAEIDAEIAKAQLSEKKETAKTTIKKFANSIYDRTDVEDVGKDETVTAPYKDAEVTKLYGTDEQPAEGTAAWIVKDFCRQIDQASSGPFDIYVSSAKTALYSQLNADAKAVWKVKLDKLAQKLIDDPASDTFTLVDPDSPVKDTNQVNKLANEKLTDYLASLYHFIEETSLSTTPTSKDKEKLEAALQKAKDAMAAGKYKGYALIVKESEEAEATPTYYTSNTKVTVTLTDAGEYTRWTEKGNVYATGKGFNIYMNTNHVFVMEAGDAEQKLTNLELSFSTATDPATGTPFVTISQQRTFSDDVVEVGFLYGSQYKMTDIANTDSQTALVGALKDYIKFTEDDTNVTFNDALVSKETSGNTAKFGTYSLMLNLISDVNHAMRIGGCAYVKTADGKYTYKYFIVTFDSITTVNPNLINSAS